MSAVAQNTPSARGMEARLRARPWAPPPPSVAGQWHTRPFWASAAPSVVGARFPIIAESLSAALGIERGQRVLDLGAGSGHIAVSAGRRGCQVASVIAPGATAYAKALLERDVQSVAREGLAVDFWRWDIADVPFEAADFDVVASSFAAMFEPDQEAMAAELVRLCRPGGKIDVVSWTPDSFVGRLFQALGAHLPYAGAVGVPFLWGTAKRVTDLFAGEARTIAIAPRTFSFRYDSAQQCLDIWRSTYAPLRRAFELADAGTREALVRDLQTLIARRAAGEDGSVALRGDYLEVVVRKRGRSLQAYSH